MEREVFSARVRNEGGGVGLDVGQRAMGIVGLCVGMYVCMYN